MFDIRTATKRRFDAHQAAQALMDHPEDGANLSANQEVKYETLVAEVKALDAQIAKVNGKALSVAAPAASNGMPTLTTEDQERGVRLASPVCTYIKDRLARRAITADLSVTTDGSGVIPTPMLDWTLAVTPGARTLQAAGATFLGAGDGDIPWGSPVFERGVAFVTPSADVSPFSEGDGPTNSDDPNIYPIRITAAYYAQLNKISIPFFQDASGVVQTGVVTSLIANILYSVNKAMVANLVSSIPHVVSVPEYADLYAAALGLIASVHSFFLNDQCVFMGGRAAKMAFLNTRDQFGRPVFTPATTIGQGESLLGYKWITDETLDSKVIFGNFGKGAICVQTGIWLQLLMELYAESGEFAFKTHCRAGSTYYGSVVPAAKPQPLVMLDTQFASS